MKAVIQIESLVWFGIFGRFPLFMARKRPCLFGERKEEEAEGLAPSGPRLRWARGYLLMRLMIEILHRRVYVYMYHTTRIPMALVYEVYIRSCSISIINGSDLEQGAKPVKHLLLKAFPQYEPGSKLFWREQQKQGLYRISIKGLLGFK